MALLRGKALSCYHLRNIATTYRLCVDNAAQTIPGHPEFNLTQEQRDFYFPYIGNRDVVGFGSRGEPDYMDAPMFPCPAIRFSENTPEFLALREKEKGDWKNLSIEEKKKLYRFNFCRTYAEMYAPTGTWRTLASCLLFLMGTGLFFETLILRKLYHGYGPESLVRPDAYDPELIARTFEMFILVHAEPITGPSSKFDYDKMEWK